MTVGWNVVNKSGWDSEAVDASLMQNFCLTLLLFCIHGLRVSHSIFSCVRYLLVVLLRE